MQFQTKSEVRKHVIEQRPQALPLMGVLKNLSQFLDHQKGSWAAFKALTEEPAIEGCLGQGIDWYYPQLKGQNLEFIKPSKWKVSRFGFHEPAEGTSIDSTKLDGFLVPGLAFSEKGERVGRGKGFYDRALAQVPGLKVGVCYSHQLFTELPTEAHDVKMDVVVSDKGITWLKR